MSSRWILDTPNLSPDAESVIAEEFLQCLAFSRGYPEDTNNRGNIFNAAEGCYHTLVFNGRRDGETAHKDKAEISLKIEILWLPAGRPGGLPTAGQQ